MNRLLRASERGARGDAISPVQGVGGQARLGGVLATARVEFALTLRSSAFWWVQGVLLLTGLLPLVSDGDGGTFLRYASDQLRQFSAFQLLFLPLLVLASLWRVRGRVGDLAFATTHDSVGHAGGVLLGVYAWLVPTVFVHFVARWVLGEVVGGQANWVLLTTAPWLALTGATLGLGTVACLSLVLPRVLPFLLVWLGLWLFLLQRSGGLFGGFTGPFMPFFDPLNVFFEGALFSPSVGLGLMRPLVVKLALLFIAVGAVLLGLWLSLLRLVDRRRSVRFRFVPVLALLVPALLTGFAVDAFTVEVAAQQPVESPRDVQLDAWRVLEHDLEVTVAPSASKPLVGVAWLTLAPVGEAWPEKLVLRLNPGLEATARVAGENVESAREGDSLVVQLNGAIVGAAPEVSLEVAFEGSPFWPYSDHRFREGGSFPFTDSSQPITGLVAGEVAYILRDGDWQPWPWSSDPQLAEDEQRFLVRVRHQDGSEEVRRFEERAPQLLTLVAPESGWESGAVRVRVGADPGSGLSAALVRMAGQAERVWSVLGEEGVPQIVALPYIPDAYANGATVVIPEAYDLYNSLLVGGLYQGAPTEEIGERAATQLLARAWLNGRADGPRGFAEARRMAADARDRSGETDPERFRLLQVTRIGPLESWSELWLGEDPGAYDVTPLALWLGMELVGEEVRADDLALLRDLTGSDDDFFALRDRMLPWSLARQRDDAALIVALADWADRLGRERAIKLFVETYRDLDRKDHDTLLATLSESSGDPVQYRGTEGSLQ